MNRKVLTWAEVLPAAEKAFAIWVGHPELRWAKGAWKKLIRAGLATYTDEVERCEIVIRLLALAGLYHDFCQVAWEESRCPEYLEWAEGLGVGAFRVGQLVGRDSEWDQDEDEADLMERVLPVLAERARGEVLAALREGFGGTSALFVSLWQSKQPPAEAETAEEILIDMTLDEWGNHAAFAWVEQGCEPRSYPIG